MAEWKDRLPGGLADDKSPDDFEPEAVLKGMAVELEHTSDRHLAVEIALDHLSEDPDYYDKLEQIEDHGEAEVQTPQVRKVKPDERVFVEGDDLIGEVGAVADALFDRGCRQLGAAALDWIQSAQLPGRT